MGIAVLPSEEHTTDIFPVSNEREASSSWIYNYNYIKRTNGPQVTLPSGCCNAAPQAPGSQVDTFRSSLIDSRETLSAWHCSDIIHAAACYTLKTGDIVKRAEKATTSCRNDSLACTDECHTRAPHWMKRSRYGILVVIRT